LGKYFKYKVLLVLFLVGFSIWQAWPPNEKVNLGLDLQGGMYVVLKADLDKLPENARKDATDRVREIILNRIDEFGVTEPTIQKQGLDRLIVQLPGVTNRDRAIELIKQTALLEFKLVATDADIINAALEGNVAPGYEVKESGEGISRERLVLEAEAVLTGDTLVNAGVEFDTTGFGQPVVSLEFNSEGAKIFSDITGKAARDYRNDGIPRRLAILLDGRLHSAPQIEERIPNGRAIIRGSFGIDEARDTSIILRAGALPCPVEIIEERTVGPSLGHDSIVKSVSALLYGFLAVVVFILLYYRFPGLIAIFALLLNIVLVAGALVLFNATLTLPGIAGIILTIGMAVDANVLIFERIREELSTGKTTRATISSGYKRAFSTIFDANLTTLITALLLFAFGTGPIKGFAVTLSIGIVTSMFTSLFVTRLVFDYLTRDRREIPLKMLSIVKPGLYIDFTSKRFIAYGFSAVIIIIGIFSFVGRGQAIYGVDFTGGTLVHVKFEHPVSTSALRDSLEDSGLTGAQIQIIGEVGNEVIIRTQEDVAKELRGYLNNFDISKKFEILQIDKVGPSVGKELREKALKAVIFALMGLSAYIWFRFEFKYGVAAIIALFHDVLITVGCLAFFGREINLPIVAAILTIVGYSLNDTIVVFDRIRENFKSMRRKPFTETVNLSISQTISRTVLTSLTTLLVICSIFIFGGRAINDFAFTLLVGVLVGTYSSVFVASPVLVDWGRKKIFKGGVS